MKFPFINHISSLYIFHLVVCTPAAGPAPPTPGLCSVSVQRMVAHAGRRGCGPPWWLKQKRCDWGEALSQSHPVLLYHIWTADVNCRGMKSTVSFRVSHDPSKCIVRSPTRREIYGVYLTLYVGSLTRPFKKKINDIVPTFFPACVTHKWGRCVPFSEILKKIRE